jgi:hypothetical protein
MVAFAVSVSSIDPQALDRTTLGENEAREAGMAGAPATLNAMPSQCGIWLDRQDCRLPIHSNSASFA